LAPGARIGVKTFDHLTSIYFSIVTWPTLGYGDCYSSENARFWTTIEAMLGYVYMGILVALIMSTFSSIRETLSDINKPQGKEK
jgi:hypothetical protein